MFGDIVNKTICDLITLQVHNTVQPFQNGANVELFYLCCCSLQSILSCMHERNTGWIVAKCTILLSQCDGKFERKIVCIKPLWDIQSPPPFLIMMYNLINSEQLNAYNPHCTESKCFCIQEYFSLMGCGLQQNLKHCIEENFYHISPDVSFCSVFYRN